MFMRELNVVRPINHIPIRPWKGLLLILCEGATEFRLNTVNTFSRLVKQHIAILALANINLSSIDEELASSLSSFKSRQLYSLACRF